MSKFSFPIIDMRSRPPFGRFAKEWVFNLEDSPGNMGLARKYANMGMELPASIVHRSINDYLEEMDQAGISCATVPVRLGPALANDDLLELLKAYPQRFMGFMGIRPLTRSMDANLEEIERLVVNGPCTGVFMEPALDPEPWMLDDERVFPLYELCQSKRIPLNVLFGGVFHKLNAPDSGIFSPLLAERVARRFPDLHMLLSHAGWPWTVQACAAAINWDNLYLAPDSYFLDHPGSHDYVVAANYRLQDKFIFGTTYPAAPMGFVVERYATLLRKEVQEKVFSRNAARFLYQD